MSAVLAPISQNDMNLTKAECAQTHKWHGVNTASRQALLDSRAGGDTPGKNSKHWLHSTRPSSSPSPTSYSGSHCLHAHSCLQLLHLPDTFHFPLAFPNHALCHTSIDIHSKPGSSNHSSHMYWGPPWLYLYPAGLIWRCALAVG